MSAPKAPLESVLTRHEAATPNLEAMGSEELKRSARFWYGVTASNKMRKAECARALAEVFRDRRRLEEGAKHAA